jgi:type II secretion system protein H
VRTEKGFTLIELIIVIGLIGIMSTVAVYSWQGYRDNINLRTAAREVMSDIASCKQRSVSEGVEYCIQFTDGSPNYSINASSCDTPTQTQAKNLTNFGSNLYVYTNFNSNQLGFLPRGTLSSNTGTIWVRNSRYSWAVITLNITGRTYVWFYMQ